MRIYHIKRFHIKVLLSPSKNRLDYWNYLGTSRLLFSYMDICWLVSRIHVLGQKLSRIMAGKTLPLPQRRPCVTRYKGTNALKKIKEKFLFFSHSVQKQVNEWRWLIINPCLTYAEYVRYSFPQQKRMTSTPRIFFDIFRWEYKLVIKPSEGKKAYHKTGQLEQIWSLNVNKYMGSRLCGTYKSLAETSIASACNKS